MGHLNAHNFGFQIVPAPVAGTAVNVQINSLALLQLGMNLMVEISTASAFRQPPNPQPLKSMAVMAHLDTGASRTSIDQQLAIDLGLTQTGVGNSMTAAGQHTSPNYAIDLAFVGTNLKTIINLQVGSCKLPFDKTKHQANQSDPTNFGLLLGRDIMQLWHITWHGPTSSVYISD